MAEPLVLVVDGQGGGVGKALVERVRARFGKGRLRLLALGTNSMASSAMLKAGADDAATGENAIVVNVRKADVILGALGIVAANSMLGELTPAMAEAISSCDAVKLLVPINRCHLQVAGVGEISFSAMIDAAVEELAKIVR